MTGCPKLPPTIIPIEAVLPVLKTSEEAREFLAAVLSEREFQQLQNRWTAYQYRAQGMTLAGIARTTGIATATASRAAKLHRTSRVILDGLIARARRRAK
jgi:uncharacterized protein YerC